MSKPYIYISRKDALSASTLADAKDYLLKVFPGMGRDYHEKGTVYDTGSVPNAKVMVVLVASGDANTFVIGKGVDGEIDRAKNHNIPIYIMYKRRCDNTWQFYELKSRTGLTGNDWSRWAEMEMGSNWSEGLKHRLGKYTVKPNYPSIPESANGPGGCYAQSVPKKHPIVSDKQPNLNSIILRRRYRR